ncbi:MAG: amidohydrolase family protein [Planctomycetota bacterium]|nr:amidohydrolase family protein [Planctomycetota bacterium]
MTENSDDVEQEAESGAPTSRRGGRFIIYGLILLSIPFIFGSCVIDQIGGAFDHQPEEMADGLSPEARALMDKAFTGIKKGELFDYHTHIVGLGADNSGVWVNPHLQSWWHPSAHMKFLVYYSAAGIEDDDNPDKDYVRRFNSQVSAIDKHGRYLALAFDYHYDNNGLNKEKSEFHVPNAYTYRLSQENPNVLVAAMSVHPYRGEEALKELDKWAAKGVRIIKWLPNAMGINPSDDRCIPFYERMKKHKLILLSHAGEEKAVEAEEDQKLGNPLLLRKPLDMGVKVIVAHCASLGTNEDLDNKGAIETNFRMFLRMMDNKKYVGKLYGEISAMTQFNRMGEPLETMLKRTDLHSRLVNGSDYPLPAVNVVIRTSDLAEAGYITYEEQDLLNEIYDYNPLLFDYVLKRTIKHPATKDQFPNSVFKVHPDLNPVGAKPAKKPVKKPVKKAPEKK